MITIRIPTPLRAYTEGKAKVNVSGAKVQEALDALMSTYPQLSKHLLDSEGRLRSFINIYGRD